MRTLCLCQPFRFTAHGVVSHLFVLGWLLVGVQPVQVVVDSAVVAVEWAVVAVQTPLICPTGIILLI